MREVGLGEMLIGGGVMSRTDVKAGQYIAQVFDFTATYMSIPPVEVREQEHPYTLLAAEAREARAHHAVDAVPWVPYLAAGWNPRSWTHPEADPNHRRFFTFPTRDEWTNELRQLRDDFNHYPTLGLPLPGGQRPRRAVFRLAAERRSDEARRPQGSSLISPLESWQRAPKLRREKATPSNIRRRALAGNTEEVCAAGDGRVRWQPREHKP
ncbi:MAG: hypothetical protein NTY53_02100 [Kiritimatiellaeota bacterium]|nr:hypothetical protein [Kiritimatiellota bacterium]